MNEITEQRLRDYLAGEAPRGDLSPAQWEAVLRAAVSQRQSRGWTIPSLLADRRTSAIAASVVVLAVAGCTALVVTSPWDSPAGTWFTSPIGMAAATPTSTAPGLAGVPIPGPSGIPAPNYFDSGSSIWSADKTLLKPGDPVTISAVFKNISGGDIDFVEKPVNFSIDNLDLDPNRENATGVPFEGTIPDILHKGDTVTLTATVPSKTTSQLTAGRYHASIELRFAQNSNQPDLGTTTMGLNSDVLFTVLPPQGAMSKTIDVNEAHQIENVRMTLESLEIGPEQSKVHVLAEQLWPSPTPTPMANAPVLPGAPTPTPTSVPTPTAMAVLSSTPTPTGTAAPPTPTPTPTGTSSIVPTQTPGGPTATPTPAPFVPDAPPSVSDLTAYYRTDGGDWVQIRQYGYRPAATSADWTWTFGPVASDAKTFELAVTSDLHDESGALRQWKWTVNLQAGD